MEAVLKPLIEENQQLRASNAAQSPMQSIGEGELPLVITGIQQRTPHVRAYQLRHPLGQALPKVSAGAHLSVPVILANGLTSTRNYSICSHPDQTNYYEIAVLQQAEGQGGSRFIHEHYQLGLQLQCGLPRNDFALHNDDRSALLIAGGIGITPLLAMARTLKQHEHAFQLHYIGRTIKEMAYVEKLQHEFGERLNLHISTQQAINLEKIMANVAHDAVFYVCGSERLLKGVQQAALSLGIAETRLRFERFSAPEPLHAQAIEVELRRSGKTLHVKPDESILTAVEAAGVKTLSDCKVGNCGTCAVNVLEGIPQHLDSALTERERTQGKKMCICVSRANSSKLVLDL